MREWNRKLVGCVALLGLVLACAGCGSSASKSTSTAASTSTSTQTSSTATTTSPSTTASTPTPIVKAKQPKFGTIALSSSAFTSGGAIDSRYTCDGAGTSPPLRWTGVPKGAAELVLVVFDLSGEAKTGIQWAVAGIPPSTSQISAGALPAGVTVGANSLGKNGWAGVCAKKGVAQHLIFLLYAMSKPLGVSPGFNALAIRARLKSDRLASGVTAATYERT